MTTLRIDPVACHRGGVYDAELLIYTETSCWKDDDFVVERPFSKQYFIASGFDNRETAEEYAKHRADALTNALVDFIKTAGMIEAKP